MKNVIKNIPIIDNFIYQFILSILAQPTTALHKIHAVCSLGYLVTVYGRAGSNDMDLTFYGTWHE